MARGFAASKTKREFFVELGLVENQRESEEIYEKMLEEATQGRQRIVSNPANLVAQARSENAAGPYTYNQITEGARHREIQNIYERASPETRVQYEKGRYSEGGTEENWVVKWCLYHSFRYTDNRNSNRVPRSAKNFSHKGERSDASPEEGGSVLSQTGTSSQAQSDGDGREVVFILQQPDLQSGVADMWSCCKFSEGI